MLPSTVLLRRFPSTTTAVLRRSNHNPASFSSSVRFLSSSAVEEEFMGNKSSKSTDSSNMDVKDFITQENSSNQVVIWSKTYCGYCSATKKLFSSISNVQVSCHELDRMPNGSAIQNELANMTGQRSVPNVFVNNQHLGGNDDTQAAYRNGTLAKMLGVEKL